MRFARPNIASSTVNSYNGLVHTGRRVRGEHGRICPLTHMTYGNNDRSCMVRLAQSRFCIENRAADMCMNPYLSLGMTTAATVAGMAEGIDPGPPLNRYLDTLTDEEIRRKRRAASPAEACPRRSRS